MGYKSTSDSGHLMHWIQKLADTPIYREQEIRIPYPAESERASKNRVTNIRFRLYATAKQMRGSGDNELARAGQMMQERWKIGMELQDFDQGVWELVLMPRRLDPTTQAIEQGWAKVCEVLDGVNPLDERKNWAEEAMKEQAKAEGADVERAQTNPYFDTPAPHPAPHPSPTPAVPEQKEPEPESSDPSGDLIANLYTMRDEAMKGERESETSTSSLTYSDLDDQQLETLIQDYLEKDEALPPDLEAEHRKRGGRRNATPPRDEI